MSWQMIILPFMVEIDPKVVEIGKLGWAAYERADKPEGFAMFHAKEGTEGRGDEQRIIYLSPVAAEICKEIGESYALVPCDVPARDEPDMAFVFGDPRMMGQLQDSYEAKLAQAEAKASAG
jgi:hypothetical protein